jgi:hypothetical protein
MAYMSPTIPNVKNPNLTEYQKVTFQSKVSPSSHVGPREACVARIKVERNQEWGESMHICKLEHWKGQVDTRSYVCSTWHITINIHRINGFSDFVYRPDSKEFYYLLIL